MKPRSLFTILACLIWIFAVPIAISFATPHLRDFLGDVRYTAEQLKEEYRGDLVDPDYHWHARHYWFFWGCMLIWLLSLFNCGFICRNALVKDYPSIGK